MAHYVRPFEKEDLTAFEPIEPIGKDELAPIAQSIEDSGLAVTSIREGKVIACAGVHPVNDEQGELWLRTSKECLKFPREMARLLISGLKIIEEEFGFRQLYAVVQDRLCKSKRLMEKCGYKQIEHRTEKGIKFIVYSKLVTE